MRDSGQGDRSNLADVQTGMGRPYVQVSRRGGGGYEHESELAVPEEFGTELYQQEGDNLDGP
jgi:hypothetical protein